MSATAYMLAVILFTTRGPAIAVTQEPDRSTCEAMAANASDVLTGKEMPAPNGEKATILDAQGFCNVATQKDHV